MRQHQRKCTVMFELSVTLERVLEFLAGAQTRSPYSST
jgi:hypothetical protein